MTLIRSKLIPLLSILVCLVLAAGLIKLAISYRENREETGDTLQTETGEEAIDTSIYQALTWHNGSTTLTFEQDEDNAWVWTVDHKFPLDTTTVEAVLAQLETLVLTEVVTAPEDLSNYGLSSPSYTLTAEGKDIRLDLAFGKQLEESGQYYVLKDNDQSAVYVTSGDLLPLMDVPIYDMMILPELPDMSAMLLDFVRIRGRHMDEETYASYTVLTAQWPEAGEGTRLTMEDVSWRSNGANVTDDPTVQSLVADMQALTITKCMDYNPSAAAVTLCGFDSPTAWLDITYHTVTGLEGELSLTIGNLLADGSGRYVRIGEEDTTLYALSNDLLDPLIQIAEQGLE